MRPFAFALALLMLLAPSPAEAGTGTGPEDAVSECLALLHDGRFDEADEAIARAGAPEDPERAFFEAFVVYWRLLYDSENPALKARLDERLGRAISASEGQSGSDDAKALFAGSSHLLLAELRASDRKLFAAAGEARRAKRILEAAARSGRIAADASFALGTYNYMADRAPTFVKGLRALLFLPGGDREEGLKQLERAGRESRWFRLEARILLSTIYSSRHERLFDEARRQARLAADAQPKSVAALHAAGRLELSLFQPERAAKLLAAAAERAAASRGTAKSVVLAIELQRARAEFAMLRPDLALSRTKAIVSAQGVPRDLAQDARKLADALKSVLEARPAPARRPSSPGASTEGGSTDGQPVTWWARARGALERSGEGSPGALVDLAAKHTDDPVLALLAGRELLRAGRAREALPLLLRAGRSEATPRPWQGTAKLLAGQAADLCGRRPQAIALYREAVEAPSFIGRDAAYLHQKTPFRGEP